MATKKERSAIGKALAGLRRKVRLECPVCGKVVRGSKTRRYCSAACRQEAYRQRRRADGPTG